MNGLRDTEVAAVTTPTVEALARALYETDSGHNGYPPLHEDTPWEDIQWRLAFYDRAREIIRKLEIVR